MSDFSDLRGVIISGVVIQRLMPNDSGNRSRKHVEYTIDPLTPNYRRIYGAILVTDGPGYYEGRDRLLRPASRVVRGGGQTIEDTTPRGATDGDHVVVQFLDGRYTKPIITGVLPHPQATWRRSSADGIGSGQVEDKHRARGSTVLLDYKGNVIVNLETSDDPITPTLGSEKEIVITIDGQEVLKIKKNVVTMHAGAVEAARNGDTVQANPTTDASFFAFTTAVDIALRAALAALPPALAAYTAAVTTPPTRINGQITEGTAKLLLPSG